MSELEQIWQDYEGRLSLLERHTIATSPVAHRPLPGETCAFLPRETVLLRLALHAKHLQHVHAGLGRGYDLFADAGLFHALVTLAATELHLGTVQSWPGFACLFHKLLNGSASGHLPMLFQVACLWPGVVPPAYDPAELRHFLEAATWQEPPATWRTITVDDLAADLIVQERRERRNNVPWRER